MKKVNYFMLTGGISALFILLLPRISLAQSNENDSAFTGQALIIGFLVLSIFMLVFLGLLLKARVNELQSFRREDIQENLKATRSQKLMSLDEEEVESLLEKRLPNQGDTSGAAVK